MMTEGEEMGEKHEFEALIRYFECQNGYVFGAPYDLEIDSEGQIYHVTLEPIEPELKPCPFCGGQPHPASGIRATWCKDCGAEVNRRTVDEVAMEMWNRRAS